LIIAGIAANGIWQAETTYYRVDWMRVRAAEVIAAETPGASLVIAVSPQSSPIDPRLLYQSRRDGWSIDFDQLAPGIVEMLGKEGRQDLPAFYPAGPLPAQLRPILEGHRVRTYDLSHDAPRALPRRFSRWRLTLVTLEPTGT